MSTPDINTYLWKAVQTETSTKLKYDVSKTSKQSMFTCLSIGLVLLYWVSHSKLPKDRRRSGWLHGSTPGRPVKSLSRLLTLREVWKHVTLSTFLSLRENLTIKSQESWDEDDQTGADEVFNLIIFDFGSQNSKYSSSASPPYASVIKQVRKYQKGRKLNI